MKTLTSKLISLYICNETVIEEEDIIPFENPKR